MCCSSTGVQENSVFLSVIECNFTQDGAVASCVTMGALVKKLLDALLRYECLVEALLARRFCFIAATFQGIAEDVTVEQFAGLVVAKLAQSDVKSSSEITTQLVFNAVLLLRRDHLKCLLICDVGKPLPFRCKINNVTNMLCLVFIAFEICWHGRSKGD